MNEVHPKKVATAFTGQYRELTFAAVFLGILQGVVLNLAFVYAALNQGFPSEAPPWPPSWGTPCSKGC